MSRDRNQRPGDAAPARESVHDPPGGARAENAPQARADHYRAPQAQTSAPRRTETESESSATGTGTAATRPASDVVGDARTTTDAGHGQAAGDVQAIGDAETTDDRQAAATAAAQARSEADTDAQGVRDTDSSTSATSQHDLTPEQLRERLRRRAIFLRELAEARELRRRVTPHRSRRERLHAVLRRRTFRFH